MTRRRGIATRYEGVLFRSRLEAKWAAFFDIRGWDWVYEPMDGTRYTPDFLLLGAREVLVEVKPKADLAQLTKVGKATAKSMGKAWKKDILVLGLHPHMYKAAFPDDLLLGALGEPVDWGNHKHRRHWGGAAWSVCWGHGDSAPDEHSLYFAHDEMDYTARPCGHHSKPYNEVLNEVQWATDWEQEITQDWREAGNEVQWNAPIHACPDCCNLPSIPQRPAISVPQSMRSGEQYR